MHTYKLYINKVLHKEYSTLKGVRIAFGLYSRKFDRGELISTPGQEHLSWIRVEL